MSQQFEEHQRPLPSRLEKWRREISQMRAANWPHIRIADWLRTEKEFEISQEAIRQFCIVRGITKRGASKSQAVASEVPIPKPTSPISNPRSTRKPKSKKLFDYDDTAPIETRHNR